MSSWTLMSVPVGTERLSIVRDHVTQRRVALDLLSASLEVEHSFFSDAVIGVFTLVETRAYLGSAKSLLCLQGRTMPLTRKAIDKQDGACILHEIGGICSNGQPEMFSLKKH